MPPTTKLGSLQRQEHQPIEHKSNHGGSITSTSTDRKPQPSHQLTTHHDGFGGVAAAGVDEVGDGVPFHPDDALGDGLARVLGGDHQHDVPGRDPAERRADPVHRHHIARQVHGRQHAGAPHEGERAEVLVHDVDGAVGLRHQEHAREGVPRDAPPRDARETPNEARHGGGVGGGGGEAAAEESLERSVGQLGLGLLFLSAYKSHAMVFYVFSSFV